MTTGLTAAFAGGFTDAFTAGGAGTFAAGLAEAFDTGLATVFVAGAPVFVPDTAGRGVVDLAWADEDFFTGFFKETSDMSDAGLEPGVGGRTVRGEPVWCWLDGTKSRVVRIDIADRRRLRASNSRPGAA